MVQSRGEHRSAWHPQCEGPVWCRVTSRATLWDPEVSTPCRLATSAQGGVTRRVRVCSAGVRSIDSGAGQDYKKRVGLVSKEKWGVTPQWRVRVLLDISRDFPG
ncbi:hypothetical protein NDU88_003011 [Pleurodeles waltl]|uniref:Uncharacterized protein n=1 Tax=Pleurodeles waltl TaxID=8319 RepID=A0AAV7W3S3_PLEWA|nr:hypothetical protein NDU88_003011 [Pleurodeles waltl]